MKAKIAILCLLLTACSSIPPSIEEARKRFGEGRGEEALALLQQAARENPNDAAVRGEYFRLRDLQVAQWLAQAEVLRASGQFDLAETLLRRVQTHDAGNARAASGLVQFATDRRDREVITAAEQLAKSGKFREAQDLLRPVLAGNPQQRDARRLQRAIDEKLVRPVIVSAELRPATAKPVSLELRDVTVRNVFEVLRGELGPHRLQRGRPEPGAGEQHADAEDPGGAEPA